MNVMPHIERKVAWAAISVAGILVLQTSTLIAMGHPLICSCGHISLWYSNPAGPETSQQLTDWYTWSHIIHGFLFYLLLWVLFPRMHVGFRFAMAVGLEAGWELIENTSIVIERYRESALARGYYGDSVINSVFDTFAAMLGFVLARKLPVLGSVAFVIAVELFMLYMIRDNLTLNIIQLLYPSDAISRWQTHGSGVLESMVAIRGRGGGRSGLTFKPPRRVPPPSRRRRFWNRP